MATKQPLFKLVSFGVLGKFTSIEKFNNVFSSRFIGWTLRHEFCLRSMLLLLLFRDSYNIFTIQVNLKCMERALTVWDQIQVSTNSTWLFNTFPNFIWFIPNWFWKASLRRLRHLEFTNKEKIICIGQDEYKI